MIDKTFVDIHFVYSIADLLIWHHTQTHVYMHHYIHALHIAELTY